MFWDHDEVLVWSSGWFSAATAAGGAVRGAGSSRQLQQTLGGPSCSALER